MAATETMQKNAQIEAENRRNRELVNQQAAGIVASAANLTGDIAELEKEAAAWRNLLKDTAEKAVMPGIDTADLFNKLLINYKVSSTSSEVLKIDAKITTDYLPKDIPNGTKMTIDGFLKGVIYSGSIRVGEFILALPIYGVECGNSTPVSAISYCDNYAKNKKKYSIEFEPISLWLMEL